MKKNKQASLRNPIKSSPGNGAHSATPPGSCELRSPQIQNASINNISQILLIEKQSNLINPWNEQAILDSINNHTCLMLTIENIPTSYNKHRNKLTKNTDYNIDLESSPAKYEAIDRPIVGFMIYNKTLDEIELLNIAIDPEYRNKGYAQILLNNLLIFAKGNNVNKIFLEVRESNTPAIKLYKKIGFTQVATRKNYYPTIDNREDALIFKYHL